MGQILVPEIVIRYAVYTNKWMNTKEKRSSLVVFPDTGL